MIDKINHYSLNNPATIYDEEALTVLELVGRTASKVNETVGEFNSLEETTTKRLDDMVENVIPREVGDEVSDYVGTGKFDNQISLYLGGLNERVDNLLGSVEEGSTTLDAEVIDIRVDGEGVTHSNAGSAVRSQSHGNRLNLRTMLEYMTYGETTLDLRGTIANRTVSSSTSRPNTNNPSRACTVPLIECPDGASVTIDYDTSVYEVTLYIYDSEGNCVYTSVKGSGTITEITSAMKYMRLYFKRKDEGNINEGEILENIKVSFKKDFDKGDEYVKKIVTSVNLFDLASAESGYVNHTNGRIINDEVGAQYVTSDFIPVKKGDLVSFFVVRKIACYDRAKNHIADAPNQDLDPQTSYIMMVDFDGYVRASVSNDEYATSCQIEKNGSYTGFTPYSATMPENIHLSATQEEDVKRVMGGGADYSGNILYGKKYVAYGDSFTHGDFTGMSSSDYKFTEVGHPFRGKNKVYPYFIGARNNMTVENMAENGMVLIYKLSNSGIPSLTRAYKECPEDADYVTIKIGINDCPSHQNSTLGTIDSISNTQFYGAWNKLFEWFRTNRPFVKLGVIVSNGIDDEAYVNATIECCEKWGYPYLNLASDPKMPRMPRSLVGEESDTVNTMIDRTMLVDVDGELTDDGNLHPNPACHEYESTIIEAWMRTL